LNLAYDAAAFTAEVEQVCVQPFEDVFNSGWLSRAKHEDEAANDYMTELQ
jgi:hypothetical protein